MTLPGDMKRVEHSDDINITNWPFYGEGDGDALRDLLMKGVAVSLNKTLREELVEHPPNLSLPVMWSPDHDGIGGKCPADPATLYLTLPLGEDFDENVCWELSLEAVVDDLIESIASPESAKVIDDDNIAICHTLSARLRELSDKLDAACAADALTIAEGKRGAS